ncbi:MAG: 16S rRNA (cytosine(1402)-N(4))-methyltransferase RsmH [Rhodospirillales bacterium]|nr:16S rRNA (cytosine(1402)-N(4))-methyltransferase RsmH [Rhodospirillales bacterium]
MSAAFASVSSPHIPVMLDEVLAALNPRAGEIYVDGTLGAGGYSRAILNAADCRVIGIDRDPWAVEHARGLGMGERLIILQGRFGDMKTILIDAGFDAVDAVILDIGVSSVQLDQAERGFSFRADAPLDMRMGTNEDTPTAADIVNTAPQTELERIIRDYGEERFARKVAAEIVRVRREAPILTTFALADLVRRVVRRSPKDQIDPATRTFQALRIAVNDELGELERALEAAQALLNPGGRLIVVTFHSLEDGIVKTFLRERSGAGPSGSRHLPDQVRAAATFSVPLRKPLEPSADECSRNPRARSARLRCAIKMEALS